MCMYRYKKEQNENKWNSFRYKWFFGYDEEHGAVLELVEGEAFAHIAQQVVGHAEQWVVDLVGELVLFAHLGDGEVEHRVEQSRARPALLQLLARRQPQTDEHRTLARHLRIERFLRRRQARRLLFTRRPNHRLLPMLTDTANAAAAYPRQRRVARHAGRERPQAFVRRHIEWHFLLFFAARAVVCASRRVGIHRARRCLRCIQRVVVVWRKTVSTEKMSY